MVLKEQQNILKRFKELYGDLTYKEITRISGIQHTRNFRIFNGYEMKLSEYLTYQKIVEKKAQQMTSLVKTVSQCQEVLSLEDLKSIEKLCVKKLELFSLLSVEESANIA